MTDINHAIERNPQSVSAHESLGILYLQSENFEAALREFDLAVKFSDKSDRETLASVLFNRAATKANLGLFSEAMDDLGKANDLCLDRILKDAIQEFRLRLVENGG
jgi:tetratricopeptide (TPR) repeat protein